MNWVPSGYSGKEQGFFEQQELGLNVLTKIRIRVGRSMGHPVTQRRSRETAVDGAGAIRIRDSEF